MRFKWRILILLSLLVLLLSFVIIKSNQKQIKLYKERDVTANDILGNSNYLAISYGGYRDTSRSIQPTVDEIKEDLRILSAMGIKLIRTYNTKLNQASNILKAIKELNSNEPNFEMYVMLGAWIDCKNAWKDNPNHFEEDTDNNSAEIERAAGLAKQYPEIVKIISVGNEAMVKWATSYYVEAKVILKWVNYLQSLKKDGVLSKDLWITSSDNFASWGGHDSVYHTADLNRLIQAVDFVSMHTYPMHDTHYNPEFWGVLETEQSLSDKQKIYKVMERAVGYAQKQFKSTSDYIRSIDIDKPIHIGESGWASTSNEFYGPDGSKATDEYKSGLYYKLMREWTNREGISCFYFEAFNEPWKDHKNPQGSENHFGLFTVDGKAKYAIWDEFDKGIFNGLQRGTKEIKKTYDGNLSELLNEVVLPNNKALAPSY